MADVTTNRALPYPEGDDVAAGPAQIQALAEAIDDIIAGLSWTSITLTAPWFGTSGRTPAYAKDAVTGLVFLRGEANHGGPDASVQLGVLPAGFRPPWEIKLPVATAETPGAVSTITIATNGVISGPAGAATASVPLEALSFPTS